MVDNFENKIEKESQGSVLKNQISYYLFFWPWFLLTIVMALIGSYSYLRYTPKVYSSSAQLQITKSDASSSFLTTEVTSLFGSRINVENDISVITSNHILSKVVQRLNLQTQVTQIGRVQSSLAFNEELPFKIHFNDSLKFQQWNLTLNSELVSITNGFKTFEINKNDSLENEYFNLEISDYVFKNEIN